MVSDTGVVGTDGSAIRFTLDGAGHIASVVAPDGRTFIYGHDGHGNLESVRDLQLARSTRYDYAEPASHKLTLVTGFGGGAAITYGTSATTAPITADLGPALSYLNSSVQGTLGAGKVDL